MWPVKESLQSQSKRARHKSGDSEPQKVQKIKITLGGKKAQEFQSNFVPEEAPADSGSDCSSSSSEDRVSGADDDPGTFRKPVCWLETRGGKNNTDEVKEKAELSSTGTSTRKRRKTEAQENEGHDQNSTKQIKSIGNKRKNLNAAERQDLKSKGLCVKKDLPPYQTGSQEERWHLQILDKGRVSCPTCKAVVRKTVEGLKKHMAKCKMDPFTCQHCGKQLKSLTGMKYHIMADHNDLPTLEDANGLDNQAIKDKLRKVLKRMGKLKCTNKSCTASFTSIMGFLYHMKKCGKEASELEKLILNCQHCGKTYKSKAGLDYHLKSEHAPEPLSSEEDGLKKPREMTQERTASGRLKRRSAQVAVYHLQEIATEELYKEWPKRKVQQDLVPDERKLKYARPGLPAFSQEVLRKWKSEVKIHRKVHCPNQGCDSVYTSVSGLKAHLCLCSRGDFEAGKYKCLICDKEFNSESGVKYHINSIHAQDWFVVSAKTAKHFEKLIKTKQMEGHRKSLSKKKQVLKPTRIRKRQLEKKAVMSSSTSLKKRHSNSEKKKKEKDCYDFSGSDSQSSSDSSCGSNAEEEENQDQEQTTGVVDP
ncbi:zinc finger protein 512-like isoform X2 [Acipenser ruthenus]|uniref:zinc finger protein 512-like isoform X2 n=1 Tax=Acipenser ruthenus TaxID=7906 RepID=UPI00145A0E1B|nr:zinc finger protein 512-like isoform X2 [Acipenser ruthenus]XP_058879660.1 zinc finger protein 512-like isoform X2 [Acipenser ruthenus]